ncbi:MAG: LysR family transcriptional regulator [Rhodobacteraceae bacterium]|nr:MAG: LysR family transcriptional regulator [Paracoccaceae bacterium]
MIDKLNFFITLARERHFGKAAVRLGITQPSLSAAIRQLEQNLGVTLINRGSRFQNLTPDGDKVLAWALKITADTRTMKEEIKNRSAGLSGTLSIGAIPTAITYIPEISNIFLNRHPNVKLRLLSLNSNEILGALERFEIDVGMTYLGNEPSSKLTTIPFYSESYCLITSGKNLNLDKETITWSQASKLRLCLLTPDMQNRRILNQYFLQDGISVTPTLETNSLIALLSHVQTGEWSSILPSSLVNSLALNKKIITFPMANSYPQHKIGLAALDREPNTPLISAFFKGAKEFVLKD